MSEDIDAALEWIEYDDSLCSGCKLPRSETFDPANEEAYDVEALRCHACGAREFKASLRAENRNPDSATSYGEYFAVSGPHRNGDG